jgi:16S rRNA (cytosine967-C5)-methyltransferase
MRDSGRLAAAIAVLEEFERRRVPLKTALADWARGARYAGAKDRAWISGLCLDALRRRRSLAAAMGAESPRAAALAALRFLWRLPAQDVAALAAEAPHGPGALAPQERSRLEAAALPEAASLPETADFPDWLEPSVSRAFGDAAREEMSAFAARADVDLRINTLKTSPEKALAALKSVGAAPIPLVKTAARIAAPDPADRAPAVTVLPAFNKGWIEVQDLGSQIAALAAGSVSGAQLLDFCAGGGGKTLALAALMANTGQLYAYDVDARRLAPIYERARRAGARNLQIIDPGGDALNALTGKMDVVFVDAPCTGAGTWRRHPDAKWRLTRQQLQRRMDEQDAILRTAARFVRPGGRLVYATCSFLKEENEDRLADFLAGAAEFKRRPALEQIAESGLVPEDGRRRIELCATPEGDLRLTPARIGADAFYISALRRD